MVLALIAVFFTTACVSHVLARETLLSDETELSASLTLLQRGALLRTRLDATLSSETEKSFALPEREIEVTFYNDSACTVPEGGDIVVSAEDSFCGMDWNFTCGCEGDHKVVRAVHYSDCASKQVISDEIISVGQCVRGHRFGSSRNTYAFVRDMGSCPCCGATCTVYGDPHISVCNNAHVAVLHPPRGADLSNDLLYGDYWLVKSQLVLIQARYRKVLYSHAKPGNHTYLTGLAVGGPFLHGNVLRIGPTLGGKVEWVKDEGSSTQSILEAPGSYVVDDLLEGHFRPHAKLVKDPDKVGNGLYFHFPSGVRLEVNRFKKHIDASITMSAMAGGPGGVDGQCGNFDATSAPNDVSDLLEESISSEVPCEELLFADEVKGDAAESVDMLQTALLEEQAVAAPETASAYTFHDSNCKRRTDYHLTYSLDPEHCELGWNFTCGCSADSKIIVATRMTPSCENATGVEVLEVPAGECIEPGRFSGIITDSHFMMDASDCPSCCDGQVCTVHGDPHITGFDQASVAFMGVRSATGGASAPPHEDMFGWGDFWLIKSEEVLVQARYRKVYYPGARQPLNHTYLTGLAVAGRFLQGNTLVVEPLNGNVTWRHVDGTPLVLFDEPGERFSLNAPDVIGKFHSRAAIVSGKVGGKLVQGVDFHLPSSVHVRIDRFGQHLDAQLRMPRSAGGQGEFDGQCGNFNGDSSDDTAELIDSRIGYQVPDEELLFEGDDVQ